MSKALKCDRCKICFDPHTVKGEWAGIKDLYFQDARGYNNREVGYRDEMLHFCPECTEKFSKWLYISKEETTNEEVGGDTDGDVAFDRELFDDLLKRLFGGT